MILLFLLLVAFAHGLNITYDSRSFQIDGKPQLLISGSFHYPRAASTEWTPIMEEMVANGINVLQTYVFWDIHEPEEGSYNFPNDGSQADLVLFLQKAKDSGLYVHLRFGPYVCAEWSNGGIPVWLLNTLNSYDSLVWRTDDDYWFSAMTKFIEATAEVVQKAGLFAEDGGPIGKYPTLNHCPSP